MTPRHWDVYAAGAALLGAATLTATALAGGFVMVRLVRLAHAAALAGRSGS